MPESLCALGRIDPLQLAWAAGFFDGEGSTVVHESHPGYLRLTVSVAQYGGSQPPEVLYRFHHSMLGLGTIEPQNRQGMWVWRSQSGEDGQAAIALLWPELGSVKRAQANLAVARYHRQYGPSGLASRPARRKRRPHALHSESRLRIVSRRDLDLAWAAGFLDGEGHFGLPRAYGREGAPDWRRIRASASQNGLPGLPPEVLFRLQSIVGGKIEVHGERDDFRWSTEGITNVRDVFDAVRSWSGTVKQSQGRVAIEGFTSQIRLHGDANRCARGHEYSHVYMSASGPKHRCNACARILSRGKRAGQGIKPRQFRDRARRYTS